MLRPRERRERRNSREPDVNPDTQPWLVKRKRMFDAVHARDGDEKRGLLRVE
jgi:hypothetical protein